MKFRIANKHASFRFAKTNNTARCCQATPSCKHNIITRFGVPEFWLTYACKRSNGYFGSRTVGNGDNGAYTFLKYLVLVCW